MTQDEVIAPVGSVANLTVQQGRVAFAAVILPDGIYGLYTADQVAAAVLRDREACAAICDEVGSRDSDNHAWDAAAAIRARGNT